VNAAAHRRGLFIAGSVVLAALLVLVGLGTWQLERKAWKEALIATLDERLAAPPAEVPARSEWDHLDPSTMEFRRVRLAAEFLKDQEALVYTSGSALRSDVSGPGYWVFTPARLKDSSIVVVNRGFVPEARRDAGTRAAGQISGTVEIVGALRWPEPRGLFTPADTPERNLWFVRDQIAMAAAKGWGSVAPFFIDQEAPVPPGGWPKPGKIEPHLRNDHLQYAITWYALAVVLLVVFVVWVRGRARETRLDEASGL
jgi:surfeit locus 1 family protein